MFDPRQPGLSRFLCAVLLTAGLAQPPCTRASLIINEFYQNSQSNREWVEFLVTADITLGTLDSYWFGNTNTATDAIQTMARFDSTEIINSFSYFTSTSDIIKAGTLIIVGGTGVDTDFNYSPSVSDPNNAGAWSFSLVGGNGFTSTNPFALNRNSGALWVSSAQPGNPTDVSNFVSAVAYLDSNGAMSGGLIADQITTRSQTDGRFQTLHTGVGGGFDGDLGNNRSLSNTGTGTNLSFGGSESNKETPGALNGGVNTTAVGQLRAVPEPAAVIPLSLLLLGAGFFLRRRIRPAATAC
jgi:hypothetical protein